MKSRQKNKERKAIDTRDCAYIAVFVALVIGAQLALSVVPGLELVTVLFVVFSFTFGVKRGMIAATAFSLLRQLVFGIFPSVLLLYLLYYNALVCIFGLLGGRWKQNFRTLVGVTVLACLFTVSFTMLDNLITPLWYGYTPRAMQVYFQASLPFMFSQTVGAAVSVGVLFLPLTQVLKWVKRD